MKVNDKKVLKNSLFIIGISMLFSLITHYFIISKFNINSTFQIAIDFVILWFAMVAICLPKVLKKKKSKKKIKLDREDYAIYLMVIPVLIINYFLISKIEINSTFQVAISFIIFLFLLLLFIVVEGIIEAFKQIKTGKKTKR